MDSMSLPSADQPSSRITTLAAVLHPAGLAIAWGLAGSPAGRGLRVLAAAALGALVVATVSPRGRLRLPRASCWLALVVVTATTTIAATLAFAHLGSGGARGVAGLVAAVAGVVVLAALTHRLAAGTRRRTWLLGLPVGLGLLAFVVGPVLTATYATAQPTAQLGSRTPSDVGLDAVEVTFPTPDGVRLAGWYVPSDSGAAVVLRHGASSTRTAVLDHAAVLHRNGYGVLMVDARGHGRSEGRAMDLGWWGELDVQGAVAFLLARPEVDPERIGVVGLSMGGEEAIGAAAVTPAVAAVVAEGASQRTDADKDAWLPGGPAGWVQRRIDQITYGLVGLATPAPRPPTLRSAAAATAPRPILLLAGDGEEAAARSIREGSPETVVVWETGVGHTRALAELPEEWEQRVIGFLDEHLGR
jgi:dienelactone hydrolase